MTTATVTPTKAELRKWHKQWEKGDINKNEIERIHLGNPKPHGKLITKLWLDKLGIDTRKVHPMVQENEALRGVIQALLDESDSRGFITWETGDAARALLGEMPEEEDED